MSCRCGSCRRCVDRARLQRWREANRERERERQRGREWRPSRRAKFPERYRARDAVATAVKAGRLERLPCERCGNSPVDALGRSAVHAHHADYGRPLEVRWLCSTCHGLEHRVTVEVSAVPVRQNRGRPSRSITGVVRNG
jgi:hypothetical protein